MKILLAYPYFIEERIHAEDMDAVPMGLYFVGAALKKRGYRTDIVDWHARQGTPERIREVLMEKAPDVIGVSILHGNRWGGIEIARMAREVLPRARIVFGGIGATFLWRHLLTHFSEIDFVVIGEGDRSFLELVRCLDRGDEKGLEDVPGIAFRKGKKIFRTPDRKPVEDLDSLPIPAEYFAYQHVTSTRGCAWRCAFCGSPRFWGGRIRFRSPEH
ncbi:MAG: cobalamin-dependent protein, partial [Deltaproteobacteria bacterium]|nr:cobalamin-dependent protein [Deltaproteobacteria bacterium]